MKLYTLTCKLTNTSFYASVPPSKIKNTYHPYTGMLVSEATEALSQLESYSNIINKDTIPEDFYILLMDAYQLLRLAGIRIAIHKGMLEEKFTCSHVPASGSKEAQAYLESVFGKDLFFAYGRRLALITIAAEASALKLLYANYSAGFPTIAEVYLGCWKTLLDLCVEEAEDHIEHAKSASTFRLSSDYMKLKSAADYQVLCLKSVGYPVFKKGCIPLLKDCGISGSYLESSCEYLYWLYFKDIKEKSHKLSIRFNLSANTEWEEEASDEAIDAVMEKQLSSVSDAIISDAMRDTPEALQGKSLRLQALLSLQGLRWDIKRALQRSIEIFSSIDRKICEIERELKNTLPEISTQPVRPQAPKYSAIPRPRI